MPRNTVLLHSLVLLILVTSLSLSSCASKPFDPAELERTLAPDFSLHSAGNTELLIVYRGKNDNPRDIIEAGLRKTAGANQAGTNYGIFIPQSSGTYLLVTVDHDSAQAFRDDRLDYTVLIRRMTLAIVDATTIPE